MKFEKLMEAVLNDNNQIAKEIIEEFNRQLDLSSISRDGYGLSREIDQKLAILLECGNLLLSQQQHSPDAMIYYIIDGLSQHFMSLSHHMQSRENLVAVTQYNDATPTCHDKLLKRGVFKELKVSF